MENNKKIYELNEKTVISLFSTSYVTSKEKSCDNMKRKIEIGMAVFLVAISVLVSAWSVHSVVSKKTASKTRVLIDAGHGGIDPGKVSRDGTLEKDLNLEIAKELGTYLKKQGMEVFYTRQEDDGLYSPGASSKKAEDLQKRCKIVENVQPNIMISIHQNSFSDANVKGSQVFYYTTSEKSKLLGESIQKGLLEYADGKNHRQAKANDSYYILKKTSCPTVIIECGFLSNVEECNKLKTKAYQKKLVKGIYQGILLYLQGQNDV